MAVRISNPEHLDVLGQSPALGVPLVVTIWDGAHPATMLAIIEGAQAPAFNDPFDDLDIGAFSFVISRTDPKVAVATTEGNICRMQIGGIDRFVGFIEAPADTADEADKDVWKVAGHAGVSYLNQARVYPPGWPSYTGPDRVYVNATFGGILDELLTEAQARGAIPALTWDFTATLDSSADLWDASVTLTIHAGTSLLDVTKQLVALGLEINLTPGLKLHAYKDHTTHLEATVILRAGRHIAGPVERIGNRINLGTRDLVEGAGSVFLEVGLPDLEDDPLIGRRETALSFTNSGDPTQLQRAGEAHLASLEADAQSITVPVTHGVAADGLYEPYVDYSPGDWVTLDVPGLYDLAAFQVKAIHVAATVTDDYTVELDLNSVAVDTQVRLKRILDQLSKTAASGGQGTTSSALALGAPPAADGTGRLSVGAGEPPRYLSDAIVAGPRITVTEVGGVGAERLQIAGDQPAASDTTYDPAASGLSGQTVQDAIDQLALTAGTLTAIDGGAP